MSGDRGYEAGVRGKKDKYYPVVGRKFGRAPLPRHPTAEQQDQREDDRKREGVCPICELPLGGTIARRLHILEEGGVYEWVHSICATDETFHKIDADTGDGGWSGDDTE